MRKPLFSEAFSPLQSWSECGTIDEMARDEARHGKALKGLLDRYFG